MTRVNNTTGTTARPRRARTDGVRSAWWVRHLSLATLLQAACVSIGLAVHQPYFPDGPLLSSTSGSFVVSQHVVLAFVWIAALQGSIGYLCVSRSVERLRRHQDAAASECTRARNVVSQTENALIVGLTQLASSRDGDTGGHLDRVGLYASQIAEAAAKRPEFCRDISPRFIETIRVSALLHDIGKVGIEDAILNKPGRLTEDERRRMQTHTRISGDCLHRVQQSVGDSSFLQMAHEIALFHHEHWNGGGYPTGLQEEHIPLSARIVAIADVYDALSARRCYKEPYDHRQCVNMIVSAAGTQFDPRLVEVFLEVEAEFRIIAARFPDTMPSMGADSDEAGLDTLLENVDARFEPVAVD